MIVDSDQNNTVNMAHDDSPPSYDLATGQGHSYAGPSYTTQPHSLGSTQRKDMKDAPPKPRAPPSMTAPTVYNYVHPVTQEHIASLLPPNHPEMICLQEGAHVPHTRYGLLGVLAAVLWFPLGIGLCLLDRKVKCQRCGHIIDDGLF